MPKATKEPRIAFCDTLRGLAALIVMLAHFTHGFNAIGGWLYNPLGGGAYPAWFLDVFRVDGAFGVAIFFLVSGFVIPMSLSNRNGRQFLTARAFRLYPTYIACAAITLTLVICFGIEPFNNTTFVKALYSATFFRDWLGGTPFDSIVWTLEIEVKFYLYAFMMSSVYISRPLMVALLPAFFSGIVLAGGASPDYPFRGLFQGDFVDVLLWNAGYISFISLGTLFYLVYDKRIGWRIAAPSMIFAIGVASQFLFARYKSASIIQIYLGAFVAFAVFFVFFRHRSWRVTNFLAEISYPLYAIHASAGYILLSVLIFYMKLPGLIALPIVVLLMIILAYGLHRVVEVPSMQLSSGVAATTLR